MVIITNGTTITHAFIITSVTSTTILNAIATITTTSSAGKQEKCFTSEHGWGSPAPLASEYKTYAGGPSSVGTKPFGFGPDFCARPLPPKVNIRMNEFVENRHKMQMVHGQKSAFPSPSRGTTHGTSRGTGVFHPLSSVQLQPNNNNNRGMKHNEVGGSKPINIPNANAGGLVKHEECHELSLADEYGLPKEWTY
ncbi:hypothetical protein TanjilG_21813 [Lupinus angustifolius]|uniref:Uncharacterized protein n=1 Tax=Lupinus angustifolius TaxID=3871 RepID=A0A394DBP4_LUPAN|nr:hypothetical protein TanjilG_21813 [Lupinus angustifolius]